MADVTLREARYGELPGIAHLLSKAFWNDSLFGDLIHPFREKFPDDFDLFWLRRARVNFWDYRWRWIVAVTRDESGKEVVAGIAQWERLGEGGKAMECRWFDPRNLLKPLSKLAMKIQAYIRPSLACDPEKEDIIERAIPYFEGIWSGERAESWYLVTLGVRPDFQAQGIGRMLVQWGLDRAREDGVCASVISAHRKDGFYLKCGFDEHYGRAGMGQGNPLAESEGGNMYWKMPKG